MGVSVSRERALQVVMAVTAVLFLAMAYPMVIFLREEPALSMMMCLYVTLGVFLLLAVRNPSAHRSLIGFTAWSSVVHAVVMGYQAMAGMVAHGEMIGSGVLALIGVAMIALGPKKPIRVPEAAIR
jgi:drug/metabolite transporter superfamily protein YnfA